VGGHVSGLWAVGGVDFGVKNGGGGGRDEREGNGVHAVSLGRTHSETTSGGEIG